MFEALKIVVGSIALSGVMVATFLMLIWQEYMMSVKKVILYGVWLGLGMALVDYYVGGIV